MERTKKDPDAILWKKTGGGPVHANIGGRVVIVKPGQQFLAREDEIPMAFRDTIIPVDPVKAAAKKQEVEKVEAAAAAPSYFLQERGGNWYDVVNSDGKIQNEKAMRKPEAEDLIKSLS